MSITTKTRQAIAAQAVEEIAFDRLYKQGKVANWQKNEQMYYGFKTNPTDSRANVDPGFMQAYIHAILSKIDDPLIFKYMRRKESQLKRAARLNSLRQADSQAGFWDLKDIAGKKQVTIYGRAAYAYYADSYNGYCSHLDPVDVYDFLVDPSAGGLDLENGRNMGRYGVIKDRSELKAGALDGTFIKSEVKLLLDGDGNATESSQEEQNKRSRSLNTGVTNTNKQKEDTDKFKFWEWFTTYKGERYKLLIQAGSSICIKIDLLPDLITPTTDFPLAPWPFWSYAAFPDLTEFWTPSFADFSRELFMAQASTINQTLDNGEAINKPMKYVDTGAIKNMAELKYRRDGIVKLKAGTDASKAVLFVPTAQIDTPLKLFELLGQVIDRNSGINSGDTGNAKQERVAIYQGDQANNADLFGLLNKSYSFGYRRFAQLYEIGVRDHLTKKVAVDIIGPDGIETEEVSKYTIFRKNDRFGITVESSTAEQKSDTTDSQNKLTFLDNAAANLTLAPVVNWKKAFEVGAKIAGFEQDDIKQLLDTSEYGNAEILSEAASDLENLLDGKPVKPNKAANLAYKQKFVDYLTDHEDDMTHEQFMHLAQYLSQLEPIIMQNMVREMNAKIQAMQASAPPAPPTSNPPAPNGGPGQGLPINPPNVPNGPGANAVPVQTAGAGPGL